MRSWCPALLLCLLPCSPLPALDRFQDSLAAAADTLGLAAVMHGLTRKDPADPLRALRAGLVAARLAELGVDPDADRARDQLRKVTRRQPGWPYAWHALALAEMRRAEWERSDPVALGNRVGTGTLERAIRHECRALAAD